MTATPIFRLTRQERLEFAYLHRNHYVRVVHSPLRKNDASLEVTHLATLISVGTVDIDRDVIVLRCADRPIDIVLPLSQVRSIEAA